MFKKILFSFALFSMFGFMLMGAFPAYGQSAVEKCRIVQDFRYDNKYSVGGGSTNHLIQSGAWVGSGTARLANDILAGSSASETSPALVVDWGVICFQNTLYSITNYVFIVLFVLAALAIAIAGIFFVMGSTQGDSAQISKARDILIYAVVGIAVALLARVIPALVSGVI